LMLEQLRLGPPLAVLQALLVGEIARLGRRKERAYWRFLRRRAAKPIAVRPAPTRTTVAGSGTAAAVVFNLKLYPSNPKLPVEMTPNDSAPPAGTLPFRCTVLPSDWMESTIVVRSV